MALVLLLASISFFNSFSTIPIYEAKYEHTLEGFAEPTDNPFDSGEEVLGIPKRGTEADCKALEKRKRERNQIKHFCNLHNPIFFLLG
jgi:hypothetical protein